MTDASCPAAKKIDNETKFRVVAAYAGALVVLGLFLDSPDKIALGLFSIIQSPGVLLTDYMVIGGLGAAFINSGLVALIGLALVRFAKLNISGPIIAAIFTMAGFALFGKNVLNIWPIFIGVYLYAKAKRDRFGRYILPALFGTTLAPMVSQFAFGFNLNPTVGIVLGILFGVLTGFILSPLATHMLGFHRGYNIYNIGVTGGFAGTILMSLFRGHGLKGEPTLIWGEGFNSTLIPIFVIYFVSLIILGLVLDPNSWRSLGKLFDNTGALVTDFIDLNGFGVTCVNMGLVGLIGIIYILLTGSDLNGPTLGGLLTMVGFGAFGKHVKNIIPIMLGVYVGATLKIWSPSQPGVILAALFGTTLAPIAGTFGPFVGLIAGYIHLSVVMNVGYLHGGMNLYNNGFAGGIVAALMISVLGAFVKIDK
jgi:hypothetical protein